LPGRGLHQRQRIGVTTLRSVEISEVVERFRNIGMAGTERFLANRQRSPEERLGIGIATLVEV
jgi:hypothetical protein